MGSLWLMLMVARLLAIETLPIMWILGGIVVVLVVALWVTGQKGFCDSCVRKYHLPPKNSSEATIPQAPQGSIPRWLILDLQTTGLSIEKGREDRIVEGTWLILDEEYLLIRRRTVWIDQATLGSMEARLVHHLSEQDLGRDGVSELDFLSYFFEDFPRDPVTLVMHNATFDSSMLRGLVTRLMPEKLHELEHCPLFCTMKYPVEELGYGEHYPRLSDLSMRLLGVSARQFHALRPVSWRNAYYTRLCLIALLEANR